MTKPKLHRWLVRVLIFGLTSMSAGAFLLCPCDCVTVHNHYAISLVTLAILFAASAAICVYRYLERGSGITGFLHAVIAVAFVGIGVFVELFLSMEAIAWFARSH